MCSCSSSFERSCVSRRLICWFFLSSSYPNLASEVWLLILTAAYDSFLAFNDAMSSLFWLSFSSYAPLITLREFISCFNVEISYWRSDIVLSFCLICSSSFCLLDFSYWISYWAFFIASESISDGLEKGVFPFGVWFCIYCFSLASSSLVDFNLFFKD